MMLLFTERYLSFLKLQQMLRQIIPDNVLYVISVLLFCPLSFTEGIQVKNPIDHVFVCSHELQGKELSHGHKSLHHVVMYKRELNKR